MTRFKELKRIEIAIKNADRVNLVWAESYCKMRIQIATLDRQKEHWRGILKSVEDALSKANRT